MSLSVIILLILILAAFVFAFLGARTWHWGHIVVLMGVFLSTLGFFVLASEVLRVNKVLQTEHQRVEKQLNDVLAQNMALEKGTRDLSVISQMRNEDPPLKVAEEAESMASLADLEHELLLQSRDRGRVWRGVKRTGDINPQTGAMTIGLPGPNAGLKADTVVYLFEEGPPQPPAADGTPQGPQFLGEFRVTQAAGQQATLTPTRMLDDFEKRRLAGSRATWSVYESMPTDRHDIFADKTEAQLKQLLPASSVNEYVRDGEAATADDDPARQVGFDAEGKRLPPDKLSEAVKRTYSRRLRDYAIELDLLADRRLKMEAAKAAVEQDIERLKAAQESALKLQAFRKGEKAKLTTELAGITKERQAIEKHLAQVEAQLARARQLLAETLRRNSEMVQELSNRQIGSSSPSNGAASRSRPPAGPLALGTAR